MQGSLRSLPVGIRTLLASRIIVSATRKGRPVKQQVLRGIPRAASFRAAPGSGATMASPDPRALELLNRAVEALARNSRHIPGSEGAAARRRLATMDISVRILGALCKRTQLSPKDHLILEAMGVLFHRLAAQLAEARLVLLGVYGNVRAEPQTRHANLADPPFSRASQDGDSLVNEMAAHLVACDGFKAVLVAHFATSRELPTAHDHGRLQHCAQH
jgi:hypothetical protein